MQRIESEEFREMLIIFPLSIGLGYHIDSASGAC